MNPETALTVGNTFTSQHVDDDFNCSSCTISVSREEGASGFGAGEGKRVIEGGGGGDGRASAGRMERGTGIMD